jgi:hypothetical protein
VALVRERPPFVGEVGANFSGYKYFFVIIPVYLQSVQVHSVNWLKEVDLCLGEGHRIVSAADPLQP